MSGTNFQTGAEVTMPENIFFTPSELAREINQGESSVRFWLNRFTPWFIHRIDRGQKQYAKESIATLLMIADKIDQGMIPTQIETLLADRASTARQQTDHKKDEEKIQGTTDNSLEMIQSILGTMTSLQERIATAQERRAGAEEQKARAMEKRAAAEEQKALAMNAIARALGQINHAPPEIGVRKNLIPRELLLETTRALGLDHNFDQELDMDQSQAPGTHETAPPKGELIKDTDDLSPLVYDEPELDDLDMDDLSSLFKDEPPAHEFGFKDLNLDDLSLLVDEDQEDSLDDLNLLLDNDLKEPLDDLSMLVDHESLEPLDDLNLLVNDEGKKQKDHMSQPQPVGGAKKEARIQDEGYPGLDNLGMLVEEKKASPGIRPLITPEENFELYKSEIINIIIQLKKQGLSVDETTGRFNDEGVLTLSGKPRWSTRAIEQIYRFIDAVKK